MAMARGITEITMSSVRPGGTAQPVAKVQPVHLAASAQVRLRRLIPGATYREELHQLLVPVRAAGAADTLRELLDDLLPQEAAA
jgi:hypothetical protein